jgi:hypothetical protein
MKANVEMNDKKIFIVDRSASSSMSIRDKVSHAGDPPLRIGIRLDSVARVGVSAWFLKGN